MTDFNQLRGPEKKLFSRDILQTAGFVGVVGLVGVGVLTGVGAYYRHKTGENPIEYVVDTMKSIFGFLEQLSPVHDTIPVPDQGGGPGQPQ